MIAFAGSVSVQLVAGPMHCGKVHAVAILDVI